MAQDMEEYQTTFYTSADGSNLSLPPLEELSFGSVHDSPESYATVIASMRQAVPIDLKASTVGTKKSGLFYVGEVPVPPGEMLFVTNPLVMARSPDEDQVQPPAAHSGPMRDTDVCDYCFKGLKTFSAAAAGGYRYSVPAQRCTGCKLLSFCGKTCHRKAWKHFHRLECSLLKTLQRRDATFLLHLRMLLMDKDGAVPDDVVNVIRDLDTPLELPFQSPLATDIKNCALHAYHLLSLQNRDFIFVRDVLCRILSNQIVTASADETALVHCFDIALAQLNHSCEPNAFVFIEGRQARVRTIRSIQPGEEITVSLVDRRVDVYNRNRALRVQTWDSKYECKCDMCRRDMVEIDLLTNGDKEQLAAVYKYHEEVIPKAKQLVLQIKKTPVGKRKEQLIQDFTDLAEGEFLGHFHKDLMQFSNYKPFPWVRMAGASLYLEIKSLDNALYYALLAFMFRERQFGPEAVAELRILVNTLKAICELPEAHKQYQQFFVYDSDEYYKFPTRDELGSFTACCLLVYQVLAAKVYGPKLGFVRAVLRWGQEVLQPTCTTALVPGTAEFEATVHAAQEKLMRWCLGNRSARFYPMTVPTEAQLVALKTLVQDGEHTDNSSNRDGAMVDTQDMADEAALLQDRARCMGELAGGRKAEGAGGDAQSEAELQSELESAFAESQFLAAEGMCGA